MSQTIINIRSYSKVEARVSCICLELIFKLLFLYRTHSFYFFFPFCFETTVFSHYAKANAPDASVMLPTLRCGDSKIAIPAGTEKPTKGAIVFWILLIRSHPSFKLPNDCVYILIFWNISWYNLSIRTSDIKNHLI